MIVFKVADDLGRRKELLIGSVLYLVGSLIEASAANSSWDFNAGLTVLLLGRVLYGLGCGFSMHGAPAYSTFVSATLFDSIVFACVRPHSLDLFSSIVAEMSPPNVRGLLVSLKEA